MIAFCGLDCAACPALFAAKRLSLEERQKVADQWSKEFNASIKAVDVDCVGCTVREGVHVGHWSVCEMRLCGLGKGLSTCADCPEFACTKLESIFKMVPAAKDNLMGLRAK
ncbi:MAG: DUF3795 domain-containing protein [Vicinamibacteria bacterium]|nr:DUF3795 domain-containing protein [Vicinamibacteria bacterium]